MKKSIRLIVAGASIGVLIGAFFIIKAIVERQDVYTPPEDTNIYHIKARYNEIEKMVFDTESGRVEFSSTREMVNDREDVIWQIDFPQVPYQVDPSTIDDVAFTMSNVYSEQIIEENPEDLSVYGLNDPSMTAEITLTDGDIVTFYIGNKTPTRTAYYMRKEGDTNVYTLRSYAVEQMHVDLKTLRSFYIPLPQLQEDLQYFKIVSDRTIEILPRLEGDEFVGASLGYFRVTQPYRTPKYVNSQRFGEIQQALPLQVKVEQYVEDEARDLSRYGLSPPRFEWVVKDSEFSSHLLFGNEVDDRHMYAMVAGTRTVFTVLKDTFEFLDIKPIEIVDTFVLIPNIEDVDKIVITGRGKTYTAELKRLTMEPEEGEEEGETIETFFLNGKEIEDSPFRKFYQKIIGLFVDGENPTPGPLRGEPEISVVYTTNTGPEPTVRADFVQYNRDFYAAYRYGISEFLVADYRFDEMFDAAEGLLTGSVESE